jgi:hypothetical protein
MRKSQKSDVDPHDWEEISRQGNGNGHIRLRCKKCKVVGFKNIQTGVIKTLAQRCK